MRSDGAKAARLTPIAQCQANASRMVGRNARPRLNMKMLYVKKRAREGIMQGTILNVASQSNQGIILGDDGIHYTYTTFGWRNTTVAATLGMKVDFDVRGSHAVGIYQLPGAAPPSYTNPAVPQSSLQPLPQQPSYVNPSQPAAPAQPPPPQVPPYNPVQPPQTPAAAQPPYTPPPTASPTPAQPPPPQPAAYNPGTPYPPPQYQPVAAGKSAGIDVGAIIGGIAWMFLLSAIISLFIPIIGPMIGGFVGGRKSGGFVNAAIAALISAILIGGVTYLIVDFIVSFIESLPIIGFIILATPIGDLLTTGAVILALLNALPMLLLALIGGATKS